MTETTIVTIPSILLDFTTPDRSISHPPCQSLPIMNPPIVALPFAEPHFAIINKTANASLIAATCENSNIFMPSTNKTAGKVSFEMDGNKSCHLYVQPILLMSSNDHCNKVSQVCYWWCTWQQCLFLCIRTFDWEEIRKDHSAIDGDEGRKSSTISVIGKVNEDKSYTALFPSIAEVNITPSGLYLSNILLWPSAKDWLDMAL